jgi:hypothetical protein
MYRHAYTKRDELELNPLEQYDTRDTMRMYLCNAALGAIVALNGIVTGFKAETRGEKALAMGFLILELIGIAVVVRFRGTRKSRRAVFLDGLTGASPGEHLPVQAS